MFLLGPFQKQRAVLKDKGYGKKTTLLVLIAVICLSVKFIFPQNKNTLLPLVKSDAQVKNVILFIGDGMGISQIAITRIKSHGAEGRLHMERMPVTGLLYTYSTSLVTDSAAAVTALATGYRTDNGMISLSPDGKKLPTIMEVCKSKGLATGLVATSTITHATPAGFASHVKLRNDEQAIAVQYLENRVNILLGGGKQYFLPQSNPISKRKDEQDLISRAKEIGYTFVETKKGMLAAETDYLLGLFASGALSFNPEPSLAEMTQKAISIVSKCEKGFFLMIEGSQIDWAGHANDMDNTVLQTILFDEAVKVGLDFALKNKQTLVVVTADHECGGLGINGGTLDGKDVTVGWTTRGHSAVPVPILAFGPGAETFMGVNHLTDVPAKIAALLGIKNFP
jgi:alkaline phosphatase